MTVEQSAAQSLAVVAALILLAVSWSCTSRAYKPGAVATAVLALAVLLLVLASTPT